MQDFPVVSTYKLWVVGLYALIFPLFFIFTPNVFRYNFSSTHLMPTLFVAGGTLLGLYLLNLRFHFREINLQSLSFFQILLAVVYAACFAVPEEIIFRGLIQGALQHSIQNTAIAIFLSSAIFGLAHLPNGGSGLHPKHWNWKFAATAFLAGLPLGLIFAMTNSLLIPTLLHASYLIFFQLSTDTKQNARRAVAS